MADSKSAIAKTLQNEGGYANNPNDSGGETYKGISRKWHPDWDGWLLVDKGKANNFFGELNLLMDENIKLQRLVFEFYVVEYWNRLRLTEIGNQELAEKIFDMFINIGKTIIYLQETLPIVGYLLGLTIRLEADGVYGSQTFSALKLCEDKGGANLIIKFLTIKQCSHYLNQPLQSVKNYIFIKGWLKRAGCLSNN